MAIAAGSYSRLTFQAIPPGGPQHGPLWLSIDGRRCVDEESRPLLPLGQRGGQCALLAGAAYHLGEGVFAQGGGGGAPP